MTQRKPLFDQMLCTVTIHYKIEFHLIMNGVKHVMHFEHYIPITEFTQCILFVFYLFSFTYLNKPFKAT